MAFFKNNNTENQQLSQRQILENKYANSRHNILLVVIFTAINLVLLVTNSNSYFLFSAFLPYLIADLGMLLCGKYPADFYTNELAGMEFAGNEFFVITMVSAVVIILLYLLSWMSSKKKSGWMIFALVFFILDTVAMFAISGFSTDQILDVVFYAWVIISLINGITAYSKLKKLPEEPEEVFAEASPLAPQETAEMSVDEEPTFPAQ